LVYGGAASLALALLSRGTAGAVMFIGALVMFVLSSSAIPSALQIIDRKKIASFRRALARVRYLNVHFFEWA
jgi:hypothetical protein